MTTLTQTHEFSPAGTRRSAARALGAVAAVLGTPYAALNVYWAAGGTRFLAEYGSHVFGRAVPGNTTFQVTSAALAVLMGIAVVAGLRASSGDGRESLTRWAAWLSTGWIALYGGFMTFIGIAVPLAAYGNTPGIDVELYRWHTLLWDPWFLVWGLVLFAALALSRRDEEGTTD